MEYRQLGQSGLMVSVLSLGTMTFGGRTIFSKVGATDVDGARRQVDLCLEAGVNLFDTANCYSDGVSEEILGEVLEGRRDELLIATKARMVVGPGPNDGGVSRYHLIRECEKSLRRLRTDRIDLYQLHEWDGRTPLEEALEALDTLVRSGKVRYVGASNYSGWHLMKALATSDRHGYVRFVSQQIYYSLQARDAEYELVPIAIDQGLGILVWSPLAGGLLSGKYRRSQQAPEGSRHSTTGVSRLFMMKSNSIISSIFSLKSRILEDFCRSSRSRLYPRTPGDHIAGDRRSYGCSVGRQSGCRQRDTLF